MASTIVTPDRQIIGANPQELCNAVSDQFANAKADIEALQSGGSVGAAPVHLVRGASTGNVASLAAFTVANDGITLVAGERVLLKDQTTAHENGIYVVGTVGGGTAPLTRATDMDASAELQTGLLVSVSEGTAALDTLWMLTSNAPLTVGVSDLAFAQAIGALLSAAAPLAVDATAASAGVGTKAAKDDHRHQATAASDGVAGIAAPATASPVDVGTGAAVVGTAVKFAREDHAHHAPAATSLAPGFMPFADKAFLDNTRAGRGTDIADADATIAVAQGYVRNCPSLTGPHSCTLGTAGAVSGDWFVITRTSTDAQTLAIINGGVGAGTLFTFAASKQGGGVFQFDGTNWFLLFAGQSG